MAGAVPCSGNPDVLWMTSTGVSLYHGRTRVTRGPAALSVSWQQRGKDLCWVAARCGFGGGRPMGRGSLAQLPGPGPRLGHMYGLVGGSLGTGEGDPPPA